MLVSMHGIFEISLNMQTTLHRLEFMGRGAAVGVVLAAQALEDAGGH
jgi:hypothetical protein